MEIKIDKEAFLKGLHLAQSIADRKSTMPVLANVLIRSEGEDSILCAATDLRVTVVAEARAEVAEEARQFLARPVRTRLDPSVQVTNRGTEALDVAGVVDPLRPQRLLVGQLGLGHLLSGR